MEIEWIPGAIPMPMSTFNPCDVPLKDDHRIILLCYTGKRSMKVAKQLLDFGSYPVYSVREGILGWNASGLESIDQSALLI